MTVALVALTLCACVERGEFSAEEVLNRSSIANSGLLSARVMLDAQMTFVDEAGIFDGSFNAQGNIQEAGRQLDVAYTTQGSKISPVLPASWHASGRFVVLSENEAYIRADELTVTPESLIPGLTDRGLMTGEWFRLPFSGVSQATVTPDPRFLRMQSDAVRVTKDHGIVTLGQRRMYHYDVVIDPEKLAEYLAAIPGTAEGSAEDFLRQIEAYAATGQLWIDEETFLLTRAMWEIRIPGDETYALTILLELSDAGLPVTITAPADARSFPLLTPGDALIIQEF